MFCNASILLHGFATSSRHSFLNRSRWSGGIGNIVTSPIVPIMGWLNQSSVCLSIIFPQFRLQCFFLQRIYVQMLLHHNIRLKIWSCGKSHTAGLLLFQKTHDPENPIPLFEIPFYQVGNITKAFLLFADQSGIKTPTETHTAGKLEATERHLEDTRKWIDLLLSALKDQ